jgi:hypothetical protein
VTAEECEEIIAAMLLEFEQQRSAGIFTTPSARDPGPELTPPDPWSQAARERHVRHVKLSGRAPAVASGTWS